MTTADTPTVARLESRLVAAIPAGCTYASVRFSEERSESLVVRDGVLEPVATGLVVGAMVTVWVEGGEIVAPANVLRFDDTAYNLLGSNLVGLTGEVETLLDPSSYGGRSSASHRLPGALVDDMAFTL